MTTKITFIFANPEQPAAFEAAYADGYLDLVRALPGGVLVESARVWPKEDGAPTPAHRVVDVHFVDYEAACAAVAGPEAQTLFPATFQLGAGVTILFTDVEVAEPLR